jgi:hypothetical protein
MMWDKKNFTDPIPPSRFVPNVAVTKDKLYLNGGQNRAFGSGTLAFDDLWSLDLDSFVWTLVSAHVSNGTFVSRYGGFAVYHHFLIMQGGSLGEKIALLGAETNETAIYDLHSGRFHLATPGPLQKRGKAVIASDMYHVVGGWAPIFNSTGNLVDQLWHEKISYFHLSNLVEDFEHHHNAQDE